MLPERLQLGVLPLIAEIVYHSKHLSVESAFDSEQRVIAGFKAFHISRGREYLMITTNAL